MAGKRLGLVSVTSKGPRSIRARHAAALVAIAALLGQALFPHVHAVPPAASSTTAAHAQAVSYDDPRPTALAAAVFPGAGGEAERHVPTSCPLCRAQNDARSSILPASVAAPAPALGVTPPVVDPATTLAAVARDVAVSRGPPVAS